MGVRFGVLKKKSREVTGELQGLDDAGKVRGLITYEFPTVPTAFLVKYAPWPSPNDARMVVSTSGRFTMVRASSEPRK